MPRSNDIVIGAIAGIAATVTMTLTMDALHRRLPRTQRYPLPPRELTERSLLAVGARRNLGEDELQASTLLSHFGFGAATGALYGGVMGARGKWSAGLGILYAIMVWAVSYLGWAPALGLLSPATRHPMRRNLLMIAAHVMWGWTLNRTARDLDRSMRPFQAGLLRDAKAGKAAPALGGHIRQTVERAARPLERPSRKRLRLKRAC